MSKAKVELRQEQNEDVSLEHRRASYNRQVGKHPLDSVPLLKVASRDNSLGFTVIQGRVPIGAVRFGQGKKGKHRPRPKILS